MKKEELLTYFGQLVPNGNALELHFRQKILSIFMIREPEKFWSVSQMNFL